MVGTMTGNVVPFPIYPRAEAPAASGEQDQHDYSIVHRSRHDSGEMLVVQIPTRCVQEVSSMGPCTLQALLDEVVRRWPAMADEIVAGVGVSERVG